MGSLFAAEVSPTVLSNSKEKMPKGGGRAASGAGTNSSGNSYTSYSSSSGSGQPAGYSYSNANGSSYYNNVTCRVRPRLLPLSVWRNKVFWWPGLLHPLQLQC